MLLDPEFYFLNNNLYSEKFLKKEFPDQSFFNEDIEDQFVKLKSLYNKDKFMKLNEAQLEKEFIDKALSLLGWSTLYQEIKKAQGKSEKPDFILYPSDALKDIYIDLPEDKKSANIDNILVLCESKEYNRKLDTGKIDKTNPHFQLIDYLNWLKIDYGFLTNGRYWRFYDNTKISGDKIFYEIDLESIVENNDLEAFRYFYHIFKKDNFIENELNQKQLIKAFNELNEEAKKAIEEDLKEVIYGYGGKDSIFELTGKSIYKSHCDEVLEAIYENSVYLIFRLLFILYFEDKFKEILTKHKYYTRYSLETIYKQVRDDAEKYPEDFGGYKLIKQLFDILNEGSLEDEIPLFNGGLFDKSKAPLLDTPKLIDNQTLKKILDGLSYFEQDGIITLKRDYKTLSVIHLGKIYEGLLGFRFEKAYEDTYYLEYIDKSKKSKPKWVSSYVDIRDYESIKKKHKILKENSYLKGEIFLVSSDNSRKTTASYYTPQSLSSFMVKEAIEFQLSKGKQLLDLKILDNSCGSGHFLVEVLNYLTQKTLELPEKNNILELIEEEIKKISDNLLGFKEGIELDEFAILKRILLKRTIFGVDINPFAVELTKLSLWIDTFIFGTPLSFIEHHIKQGNSLIGSNIEEFEKYTKEIINKPTVFDNQFIDVFAELKKIYQDIDNLEDTTPQEIQKSKSLYNNDIKPKLDKLNNALNLITYKKFKLIEKDRKGLKDIELNETLANSIFNGKTDKTIEDIEFYANKYFFFNYEIEFPEAFSNSDKGFDIVIGNPPWDKTKFTDIDFFSQYKTDFRTLSNSKKEEFKINMLDKEYIKAKYNREREIITKTNELYKENFPYNKGAGDSNLFRFFVENNLSLLNKYGSLTYVLPSALVFEEGSTVLRKYIFDNFTVQFFYSFENREAVFSDIHRCYKFAVIQLSNEKTKESIIKTRFYQTNPDILLSDKEIINYSTDDIKELSPNHFAMMELREEEDILLLKRIYNLYPSIDQKWMNFRSELHMTNDKDLFKEKYEEGLLKLYEGKMIQQFNPKFSKVKYFINNEEFDERIKSKEIYRIHQNIGEEAKQISDIEKFIKYDREFYRIGFRAIARDTDERTLIFTLLSKNCGVGNTMYVQCPKIYILNNYKIECLSKSHLSSLYAIALFNSIILDYIARPLIQISVNMTYVKRLPVPQPSDGEIESNPDYKKLTLNALKLTLYYDYEDFKELADEFNLSQEDIPKTDKQAEKLKIENDCIVAKLYKITPEELKHITSEKYFKVLNKKNKGYIKALNKMYEEYYQSIV